ncbi:MAG: RNA methyltransferase [Clostridiales bacterium]|nr:RNA methyltransferase [Clostridiales bacterium]
MRGRDAAYQRFEALKRSREKRAKAGAAFVEGVQPIEQAVGHCWPFEAIGYAAGARLSGWATDMIGRARPDRLYEVAPELMAELSDRDQPCELIAIVPKRLPAALPAGDNPLYVLFDRPQNPGNLGTVIRSADAFGAKGLLVAGHAADPYDPACIRASVGALFAMPVAVCQSFGEALSLLPIRPAIVGTSARGETAIERVDLTGPTLLMVGNETFGLSRALKEQCDVLARIPIGGAASSLNAGCAASICLYEAARQRARAGGA